MIPEDWDVKSSGDVSHISMGQSPLSKFYNTSGARLPLVQGNADIKNRKTIIRQYSSQTTKLGKQGDIILTVRAPVGAVAKATFDCCLGRGVCSIRYPNDYLFYFLQKSENGWAKYTAGSTFDSINSEHVKKVLIPVPQPEEQKQIAAALSDIDGLIESLEQLIAKKRDMKTAAMQQLLTGKKRLPGFNGEWNKRALGELGDCIIGLTYSPSQIDESRTLVLRSSNIQNGVLKFDDNVRVMLKIPEKLMVRQNDILVCVRNGRRALIGKCALINQSAIGMTFGAFMSVYRSEFGLFIFYQFQSDVIQEQINKNLGATINQIANNAFI